VIAVAMAKNGTERLGNITQPMTRLVTTARMPTTAGFVNATKKREVWVKWKKH